MSILPKKSQLEIFGASSGISFVNQVSVTATISAALDWAITCSSSTFGRSDLTFVIKIVGRDGLHVEVEILFANSTVIRLDGIRHLCLWFSADARWCITTVGIFLFRAFRLSLTRFPALDLLYFFGWKLDWRVVGQPFVNEWNRRSSLLVYTNLWPMTSFTYGTSVGRLDVSFKDFRIVWSYPGQGYVQYRLK